MKILRSNSIGEAWIKSCNYIAKEGCSIMDDDKELKEVLNFVLYISNPEIKDRIIKKYGKKSMIKWMMSNFLEQKRVAELKNALSYGSRLFNYEGKNQIDWVINKLKKKPETKSATITLLMPNHDKGYIPCVSTLDFKIRNKKLMLIAFCRSIDFGNKAYANMLALNKIQKIISEKIGVPTGELVMHIASAHIYNEEYHKIEGMLNETSHS